MFVFKFKQHSNSFQLQNFKFKQFSNSEAGSRFSRRRKQLRVSVAELRKAASTEIHHNPVDYALTSQGRAATNAAVAAAGGLGGAAGSAAAGLNLLPKGGSQMGWGEGASTLGGSILGSSDHDDRSSVAGSVASAMPSVFSGVGVGAGLNRAQSVLSRQSNGMFSVTGRWVAKE